MSYLHYLCCLRIVLSNTYCLVFLFCFSSSFVPYVASFSGFSVLSIFDCPIRHSLTFLCVYIYAFIFMHIRKYVSEHNKCWIHPGIRYDQLTEVNKIQIQTWRQIEGERKWTFFFSNVVKFKYQ